ncbi:cell surface associated [Nothobranchius furzeri]|uniref:Cell surface associated n=1 Tax=Nothobranchius furzeri TaxID=105023 RepID=A0A9D3C059_NOTFU|nr:cell surface associated [Nothobranchius furzeri]
METLLTLCIALMFVASAWTQTNTTSIWNTSRDAPTQTVFTRQTSSKSSSAAPQPTTAGSVVTHTFTSLPTFTRGETRPEPNRTTVSMLTSSEPSTTSLSITSSTPAASKRSSNPTITDDYMTELSVTMTTTSPNTTATQNTSHHSSTGSGSTKGPVTQQNPTSRTNTHPPSTSHINGTITPNPNHKPNTDPTTSTPAAISGWGVPGWGVALLVLAALVLLLLLLLLTALVRPTEPSAINDPVLQEFKLKYDGYQLFRSRSEYHCSMVWLMCCRRTNNNFSPYEHLNRRDDIPLYTTHIRFEGNNDRHYEELEKSSRMRSGSYAISQ